MELLQQSFPRLRIRDIILANLLAKEAAAHNVGVKMSAIDIKKLRVSVVTDASWGNATDSMSTKDNGKDYWVETAEYWARHHVQPRRTLFHPGMSETGPDLHHLGYGRTTYIQNEDGTVEQHNDPWNRPGVIQLGPARPWCGKTVFTKSERPNKAEEIHEGFLQNARTSSQGEHIIIFHDSDLQYKPSAKDLSDELEELRLKSYRLKRKVVNTLSAECQALASGIGNMQWHRFLLLEANGEPIQDEDWESRMSSIPYLAVTDSKSLFDTLSKQTCPYSQIDDKRTAIDISIIKQELIEAGTVRWIDGRNMISDCLAKSAGGNYLRFVMTKGEWSLNEIGFTKFHQESTPRECMFLYQGLWQG